MVPAEARPMVRRETSSLRRRPARRERASLVDRGPGARASSGKKANLGRLALVAVVATGLLLGNLALRARVMSCGYTLTRLEAQLAATQTEFDRLGLAIANLESLQRIDEAARVRLGMVDPRSAEFVVLAPGELDRVAGTGDSGWPSYGPSQLEKGLAARAGNVLIGLVSPFVARWFYDVPDHDHPRVRVGAR
ncbi:MAG: hypothetical protein QME92_05345 [Bacillota bacterium]|nr:hypothetical protein [Bacillota bacterium]